MNKNWIKKLDHFKYGAIIGLVFPFVGFFISFLISGAMDLESYWDSFTKNVEFTNEIRADYRQSILGFCMLPNMLLFYFGYFQFKIDKFSKGLVGITLILAALSFIFIY